VTKYGEQETLSYRSATEDSKIRSTFPQQIVFRGGSVERLGLPCCMLKVKQKSIGDSIDPRDKTRKRECEGPHCMTIK